MANVNQRKTDFTLERIELLTANQSKYINPHRLHYKLNGKTLFWDCNKVHDSVAIVIYNKSSKRLVFVRQFRPAVVFATISKKVGSIDLNDITNEAVQKLFEQNENFGYTIELCAGIMDKDKTPKQTAVEEVEEETGYKVNAECLQFISSFRSGVGESASLMHMFYCEVSDETPKGKGGGIGDEVIEVIEMRPEEAKQLLYCEDEKAPLTRPTGMLFGVCWFLYEHLPSLK